MAFMLLLVLMNGYLYLRMARLGEQTEAFAHRDLPAHHFRWTLIVLFTRICLPLFHFVSRVQIDIANARRCLVLAKCLR